MTQRRTLTPEQQAIVGKVDDLLDDCDVNDALEALSAVLVALLVNYAPSRGDALTAARDIGRTLRQTVRHLMTEATDDDTPAGPEGSMVQ